ncbi:hypothetical protein HPB50_015592 [Hyalomma asiaticum]|uniref:Uncharacterized protein n=1 Tax=Hyalomma asiaticum TaxID=266040 RepID=A0ACB7SZ03_HYAAI|nr:hypothetical protein HPB50_015592 [Hyalomma asiaticum]
MSPRRRGKVSGKGETRPAHAQPRREAGACDRPRVMRVFLPGRWLLTAADGAPSVAGGTLAEKEPGQKKLSAGSSSPPIGHDGEEGDADSTVASRASNHDWSIISSAFGKAERCSSSAQWFAIIVARLGGDGARPVLGDCADSSTTMSSVLDALSDNETTSEAPVTAEELFGPHYARTLRIALISVMLVLSLLGNSVVCHRLLTSRRHRMFKAQLLFLNLALADLLVTLVTMSSQLVWEVVGRVWVAGDVACRLFKVLQTFALVSSTYMLVGIAVDRHYAICKPLAPAPKPRSLVAACWLLSLVPSLPNVFMFRLVVIRDECYCASVFYIYQDSVFPRQAYMAFVFTLVFILPLVALVTLYSCILYRMWKIGSTASNRGDAVAASSGGCAESASATLPKARLRTLKMAAIIFVAFLVTNLPYMVQEMLLAFAQNVSLGPHVVAVFGVISASNSAINPYVFLAFNGGAAAFGCDAHVRVLWRRLACSSGSRRTTATFRTAWSTLQTRNRRRSPTVKMFPSPDKCECGEVQQKVPEKVKKASLGECL